MQNRDYQVKCIRYKSINFESEYSIGRIETTTFTCNRKVLLTGFSCERRNGDDANDRNVGNLRITEQKYGCNVTNEHNYLPENIPFVFNQNIDSDEAHINLINAILLRPGIIYSITITFTQERQVSSELELKSKVRVDHDIVFEFSQRGIVTSLSLIRFDNRNYFRKIIHNPNMWFGLLMMTIGLCIILSILIIVIENIGAIFTFIKNVFTLIFGCFVVYFLFKCAASEQ